jgi:hypothetical protein
MVEYWILFEKKVLFFCHHSTYLSKYELDDQEQNDKKILLKPCSFNPEKE